MRRLILFALTLPMLALLVRVAAEENSPPAAKGPGAGGVATELKINGAIGPATSRYIEKGIEAAEKKGSRLIILEMDTPGGLDTSMRDIIHKILASKVPVVTYVSPSGSRAASAGTYILYASHIAAMAPATNLGAATPVSIGGEPPPAPGREPDDADKPDGKPSADKNAADSGAKDEPGAAEQPAKEKHPGRIGEPTTAMERKAVNDAVAYIRGLAELRGHNADWAEDAVRGAASLSASDALSKNVIDFIARDYSDLLTKLDGRDVKLSDGNVKLATAGLTIEHMDPDWRTQLLSVLTNPTIAYGLLLIGIYGLLFEGYNPGFVLPGVVGAIALVCALFAFQILSVNYAGLALIALGIAMIIGEFFMPSFGSL